MPELPEVETITRQLKKKIKNLQIEKIDVKVEKIFHGKIEDIVGATVKDIYRRAKMIVITLNNGKSLLFHLKMSGQLIYEDNNGKYGGGHSIPPFDEIMPCKHTRVIFYFSDNSKLYFNEMRMFGWVKVMNNEGLQNEFSKIGVEPLNPQFDMDWFKSILAKKGNVKIKQLLMEQSLIAGIGNIYASEICFYAKVSPLRLAKNLNNKEIEMLFKGIKLILIEAINYQGTSSKQYVNLEGKPGNYDRLLKVYGRTGEKCYRCDGVIKRVIVAGRGTFYCSKCQK